MTGICISKYTTRTIHIFILNAGQFGLSHLLSIIPAGWHKAYCTRTVAVYAGTRSKFSTSSYRTKFSTLKYFKVLNLEQDYRVTEEVLRPQVN